MNNITSQPRSLSWAYLASLRLTLKRGESSCTVESVGIAVVEAGGLFISFVSFIVVSVVSPTLLLVEELLSASATVVTMLLLFVAAEGLVAVMEEELVSLQ